MTSLLIRALETAKKYGIGKSFSSLEKMLQDSFDMLLVLTLNHEEAIDKGIEAQKHIFTEKPISLDLDSSYALCEKAKKVGLTLSIGLMRFYDPMITELDQKLIASSTDSALFYKYDGSDEYFRRLLLPSNMDIYTFGKTDPPKVPLGFNEEQLFALKMLLWSGVHQLTAMVHLFEELNPIYCNIGKNFSSLSCLFETHLRKQIILNIGQTDLPLYEEMIVLFGKTQKVECSFSSPYLNISQSALSVLSEKNGSTFLQKSYFHKTAFQVMWEEIYSSWMKREIISPLFALKVEELAKKTAEIAISGKNSGLSPIKEWASVPSTVG